MRPFLYACELGNYWTPQGLRGFFQVGIGLFGHDKCFCRRSPSPEGSKRFSNGIVG